MLLVIDSLYSINHNFYRLSKPYYWVLDTDDLVLERVNRAELMNYFCELNFVNHVGDDVCDCGAVTFDECMQKLGIQSISCFNGNVLYDINQKLVLYDKVIDLKVQDSKKSVLAYTYRTMSVDEDGKCYICITVNSEVVCRYTAPQVSVSSGVSFIYRRGNYFIVKLVCLVPLTAVVTLVVFNSRGELIDVIPTEVFKYEKYFVTRDEAFSRKMHFMQGY